MKKIILFTIPILFFCLSSFAQKALKVSQSCNYDGNSQRFDEEDVYTFPNNSEAQATVNNIIEYTGLSVNFTIEAANVPNAEAVITADNKRVILYNEEFMRKADAIGNWAAISILAHEIGHHLNYHTLDATGSRPDIELQADIFSGFVLYKMKATLPEAQAAIAAIAKEKPTANTHPPKSARLAAVANGWYKAEKQGERKPEPNVTTDIPVPEMVYVAGDGSISSFYMGKYEITKGQFAVFVAATNYQTQDDKDGKGWVYDGGSRGTEKTGITWRNNVAGTGEQPNDHPVIRVSWEDAQAYCAWLKKKTGQNYGLPSEKEWEYAAKEGTRKSSYTYAGSSNIDEVAWYNKNSGNNTHSVGSKKANALGIYDMSGNVVEWCEDIYSGSNRVHRGGSWLNDSSYSASADRNGYNPTHSSLHLGFRLSRTE